MEKDKKVDSKKVRSEVKFTVNNELKTDPENPIPLQVGNDFFYTTGNKKYIPFIGREDNFASLLLQARLTSPTQNACISTIAASVIGKGLFATNHEKMPKEFTDWAKSVNKERESLDKVLQATVEGERGQGNQFIEIVKGEVAGKKFLKIHLHSMLYCRLASIEPDSLDDLPKSVLISKEFAKKGYVSTKKTIPEIPLWYDDEVTDNQYWKLREDGSMSTMLHFKNKVSGIDYYGIPASAPSIRNQIKEGLMAQFDIDNLENNMVLGGLLIFKSAMTQEEAQAQAKEVFLTHVGKGKTGRIAVLASEEGIDAVDYKPFDTSKEGSFIESDKRNEQKIVAAHNWDSTLAGINRDSSLGNGSTYIRAIFDTKEATLLKPLRRELIDNVVIPIVKIWSDWFGKDITTYEWDFKSAMPFTFIADIKPEQFVQVNEAREISGLPIDESIDGKYLAEMTKNTKTQNTDKNVQDKPPAKESSNNN